MQYTLDSVEQAIDGLREMYPSKKNFDRKTYMTKDLNNLKTANNNIYFFGVLTVGKNIIATPKFEGGEMLDVNKNSQIIELFSNISLTDQDGGVLAEAPKGFFRGFEIVIS